VHLFIGVPTYRGIQCPQFLDSLEVLSLALKAGGIGFTFNMLKGSCYVQSARNDLVDTFLKSDSTHLLFLDDDISYSPESVLELLALDVDVVAGIYPMKTDEERYPVVVYTDDNGVPALAENGCIKAFGLPTGFILIRREVFSKIKKEYPQYAYTDVQHGKPNTEKHDFFPQGVKGGRWWGEDYAFCNLWRDMGGELWVYPNIDFVHYSADKEYRGNYHKFLLRQPKPKV